MPLLLIVPTVFTIKEMICDQSSIPEFIGTVGLKMELIQKNLFGFFIVKCGGIKFAINSSVAKGIMVLQCSN